MVEPVAAEVALVQRHSQAPALRTIGVDVRTEEEMAEVMGGLRSTRRRGIGGSGCHGNVKKIRPGGTFKKNPLTLVLVAGLIF